MRPSKCTVFLFVLTVLLALVSLGFWARASDFARGCREGFDCRGTYVQSAPGAAGLSLTLGERHLSDPGLLSWAVYGPQGSVAGLAERTDDPNVFMLRDESKKRVGMIHVAYAEGLSGMLYLTLGNEGAAAMERVDRVPAWLVD